MGTYVPPMMIFKRKRLADELKIGAPPGSNVCCNESVCQMAETLFMLQAVYRKIQELGLAHAYNNDVGTHWVSQIYRA